MQPRTFCTSILESFLPYQQALVVARALGSSVAQTLWLSSVLPLCGLTSLCILAHQLRFVNKGHGDRVFILTNINESGGIFHWKPLIGPTEEVAAPTDTLKLWRPTKRDLPTLCRFDEACHLVAFQHRRVSVDALVRQAGQSA